MSFFCKKQVFLIIILVFVGSLSVSKEQENSIIDSTVWHELECDRLLQLLNRTSTKVGFEHLKQLLYPVEDTLVIKQRQHAIKLLVEHDNELSNLQKALGVIKNTEATLMTLWEKDTVFKNQMSSFYFSYGPTFLNNYLNKNKIALQVSTLLTLWSSFSGLFTHFFGESVVQELMEWVKNKKPLSLYNVLVRPLLVPLKWHSPYREVFKNGYKDTISHSSPYEHQRYWTLGDWYTYYRYGTRGPSWYALLGALCIRGFADWEWSHKFRYYTSSLKGLYSHLEILNEFLGSITAFLRECRVLVTSAQALGLHEILFSKSQWQEMCSNMHLLEREVTYEKSRMPLMYCGTMLSCFARIYYHKNKLIPLLDCIACLDAYSSLASLYKEFRNTKTPWCFSSIMIAHKPFMEVKNCWLPLLDPACAIANTIALGGDGENNALFTGPNGSGKSTIMKALGYVIILSQGWGIAPAEQATLSLFSGCKTYLNVREDISQRLSTFMAEKKRIEEIRLFLKEIALGKHTFLLIDEPYRGTIEIEAASRVYALGLELAANKHVISVIATHLEKPIALAQDTHNFINYHVELLEPTVGNFQRTFKLKQGPARWWFEQAEKRSRFVDWLGTVFA